MRFVQLNPLKLNILDTPRNELASILSRSQPKFDQILQTLFNQNNYNPDQLKNKEHIYNLGALQLDKMRIN